MSYLKLFCSLFILYYLLSDGDDSEDGYTSWWVQFKARTWGPEECYGLVKVTMNKLIYNYIHADKLIIIFMMYIPQVRIHSYRY